MQYHQPLLVLTLGLLRTLLGILTMYQVIPQSLETGLLLVTDAPFAPAHKFVSIFLAYKLMESHYIII